MKRNLLISALAAAVLALLASSCARNLEGEIPGQGLPEGTPITMRLDFGADNMINLDVSTKAESTPADEKRIHDLYVLIFCDGEGNEHVNRGQKIYGRYFSYEHLLPTLSALDESPNEGWWVQNRTLDNATPVVLETRGVVKISTKVCDSARLVVIANIDNGISKLGDKEDVLEYLNGIRTYEELQNTQVKLTQDVVNRKDLFLMLGQPEDAEGSPKNVNTGEMIWGSNPSSTPPGYNADYKIKLRAVDAKVKFKVRINDPAITAEYGEYISAAKAVYWEVNNVPDRCYLFSDANGGNAPPGTVYFDSEQAYFDGSDNEWYYFSFYMLESRFAAKAHASTYYDRERQEKTVTSKEGYTVEEGQQYQQYNHGYYVENGEWVNALPDAAYVKFDMILTLTPAGVAALGGSVNHALTSDTIYSVHLGDFSNSALAFDDYNTLRSTCYTYEITIANSGSIYAEVKQDNERQPGQEGYLLLTDDEIVNADCHYEYHAITFTYDPETSPEKFSWYVKTPFTSQVGGGPQKGTKIVGGKEYPIYDPHDTDGTLLDYRWVKFSVNEPNPTTGYSTCRVAYPGDRAYTDFKDWGVGEHGPWDGTPHPVLMDISQLIQYIFQETDKERELGISDFKTDETITDNQEHHPKVIRATIFIDEYYYETDPRDESANPQPDPNLWRQFVNAQPREMHILSKTVQSRDRKSDVIESSHSVIQQSIQTIYNIYEPTLRSLWGCEHLDEIKYTTTDGNELSSAQGNAAGNWTYWPANCPESERSGANNDIGKENGRLNSAWIWRLYNSQGNNGSFDSTKEWTTYLYYEVNNRIPEVQDNYKGMAWSCLTRNRDNNGNHKIDPEEVRWYMASSEQLAGLWVGTESLSTSARLYQPAPGQWRSHVVSSTAKLVSWAEEGGGATDIARDWAGSASEYHTWDTPEEAAVGESVRCIRNIGTYDDPVNGLTDISYAPVTVLPDKYFTLERSDHGDIGNYNNSDASYIFHFDRLNTKSIREFSPGELPYHDQMSLNNRVYVKMITQPLNLEADNAYSVKWGDINNLVTQKGHNDYCPEGYRFPNHTEWLLMSLYLPDTYLKKNKEGNNYPGTKIFPSRTYYDRGYYGSLRGDAWSSEYGKVGWIYSDKMHCSPYDLTVTRSRCVKDDDQTGVISGKIAIEGQEIYPGDVIPIDFKFSSTASTFTDATLTLWYKKNGFLTPYDLTSQLKTPTGLQYKGTQYIRIPTVADLGLNVANLPFNEDLVIDGDADDMYIEVEFSNLSDCSGSDRLPVKMVNPLEGVCFITDAVDGNKIFPSDQNALSLNFHTIAHDQHLSGATLKLCYDGREIDVETIPEKIGGEYTTTYTRSTIDIPTLAQLTGIDASVLNAGDKPVTLKATVSTTYNNTSSGGTETLTKVFTQPLALSNPVIANFFTIADATSSKVYPGDNNHVNLGFESRGHNGALSAASLKLMKGENVVADYSSALTQPNTNEYRVSSFEIEIPSLSQSLALDDELRLVATVGNSDGLSRTLDITDLVLSNPVSGSISASGSYLYPAGSEGSVTFAFQSEANTLNLSGAVLKLRYTKPGEAQVTEVPFSPATPDAKVYNPSLTLNMPTLFSLGLTATDLPLAATLHAEVSAGNGLTAESDYDITIKSHYSGIVEIVDDFDPANGFPIRIDASSLAGSGLPVQSVKLRWKQQGAQSYTEDVVTIPVAEQALTSNTITAYWYPSWLNNTTDVVGCVNGVNDATRTYYFTAVVGSSDANGPVDEVIIGLNDDADDATMEFLKINYDPCPGNWTWQNKPANNLAHRWIPQGASDIYFASGDFIDAYLDVSNCTYDPKNPGTVDGTNDLGMDNLITFGPSLNSENIGGVSASLNWTNGNVLFYYPARNGSNNNLQIAVHGGSYISRVQPFNLPQDALKIMLKRDLVNNKGVVLVNNYSPNTEHEPDWYSEEIRSYSESDRNKIVTSTQGKLDNLTASNRQTVYVGSTEGAHPSRALYKYVRVVRKHN